MCSSDLDVNVIYTSRFCKIFFEVFHVRDQEFLLAGEILIDLSVLVKNVNHNDFLLLWLISTTCLFEAVDKTYLPTVYIVIRRDFIVII